MNQPPRVNWSGLTGIECLNTRNIKTRVAFPFPLYSTRNIIDPFDPHTHTHSPAVEVTHTLVGFESKYEVNSSARPLAARVLTGS